MSEPWLPALAAFLEELIPEDDLPGARQVGLAAEVALALRDAPNGPWLISGLNALTELGFPLSTGGERRKLMDMLARGIPPGGWPAGAPRPEHFWAALRSLALLRFFGGPAGRRMTGFPAVSSAAGGYRQAVVETFDA